VLVGDMSIVGPRPPLASEVREIQAEPLAPPRCDARHHWSVAGAGPPGPSFDNYISLDVTYVDNWSIWLDMKILARTVIVVLGGTGS